MDKILFGDQVKTIFANFFNDMSGVCGYENTFHANFCHHLLTDGLAKEGFAREYRLNGLPVDVVLFAEPDNGAWIMHDRPRVAIEFKGGAYGNRNALRDTIDADGHCDDLDKMLPYRKVGMECWFVCVDVAELGISLSERARQRVVANCVRLGINFAYHAQDEAAFLLCIDGKTEKCLLPTKVLSITPLSPKWQDCLSHLPNLMLNHSASEATYMSLLYHALHRAGFTANQLSLETYFKCAKGRAQMQNRPDMCVFDTKVAGRFNLYRNGKKERSNDGAKLGNLHALIEVKGSSATEKLSDARFAKQIEKDIYKLVGWRERFQGTGYMSTISNRLPPAFVMLAIDNRIKTMHETALAQLRQLAQAQDIHFHYVAQ